MSKLPLAYILQLENVAFSSDCKNKTYPLQEHIKVPDK